MKLQKLYSYTRQAVQDFDMLHEGDRVAVGVSGGKDSLTLLYALSGLAKFYPEKFSVIAVTVDLGYGNFVLSEVIKLCEKLEVPHHVVHTNINEKLSKGQCSLCARFRKGALNEKAKELGCNKVAYGHHMDDVVETMLLSLMFEGRFSSFWPFTNMEDIGITVIRPMIYIPEADVIGFQHKYQLPVTKNPCPFEKETQRAYVRELLRKMNQHAPGVKKRMLTAIMDGTIPQWVPGTKK